MKRVFGILALMVIASIMIAGCVQPTGDQPATPGTTPGLTETPVETETPMATATTPVETETPMGTTTTPTETETPVGTATTPTETETPMGTATTPAGLVAPAGAPAGNVTETPTTTSAANVTETPPGPPAAAVADELVSITDSGFEPSSITVPSGTTVGWTNEGTMNQTVTGTSASSFFDSGILQPGDSFTNNFRATGNYTYTSQTTGATGTVIVTPNSTTS
ncbi:hypothetical protein [Methanoculleus sp.]|uniref:cupredoxin domain-containing protein n=1 Tax=Methanoculleus sp. TaxID=90427 RepID=UPI0025D7D35B|nr:hypothetical protein [Methanoculleus sp.]